MNFDASRYCIDALLEPGPLLDSLSRAGTPGNPMPRSAVVASLTHMRVQVEKIRRLDTYRSLEDYESARLAIDEACALHASAHGASHWSPMSLVYEGDHNREDAGALFAAVEQGDEVFDPVFQQAVRQIESFRPGLLGFSVSSIDQLYGALRLAKLVRGALPGTHLCIGGPAVTRIRTGILAFPAFFDLVDSVGLHEGEALLVALAEALERREEPSESVPGLLLRREGAVIKSSGERRPSPVLDNLPPPEFDDLVPGPWLSPQFRVPLSTTRNCYHNACTFCAISRSFEVGFRQMTPERILELIEGIQLRYPGAVIKEVSEALHPDTLLRYAALAAERGHPVPFETCLRFERKFCSAEAARLLCAGGLRVAYFGLESGSQPQIKEMRKGIHLKTASDTLKHFAEAGIWCHLFFMAGLPRETERDHEASLEFIERHRPWIHSIQVSRFGLAVDSDAEQLGERYRFKLKPRPDASFHVYDTLLERGDLPSEEDSERRVLELRRLAYEGADDTLARSRRVWDAHKLFFMLLAGRPEIPTTRSSGITYARI